MKKSSSENRRLTAFIGRIDGLTNSQRNCLLYFKSLYIRHGARALHPSIETIAKRCRISSRQAQRAVAALRARGLIKLVAHELGGNGHARHYAFVEMAVLYEAYEGRHFRGEMSPFNAPINRDKMSPEKYTQEAVLISGSDNTDWASEKVRNLLAGCGA